MNPSNLLLTVDGDLSVSLWTYNLIGVYFSRPKMKRGVGIMLGTNGYKRALELDLKDEMTNWHNNERCDDFDDMVGGFYKSIRLPLEPALTCTNCA